MQQVSTGTVKIFSTSCARKMILTFIQNGISLQKVMGKALVMGLVRHVTLLNIRNDKILVYITRSNLDHWNKNVSFNKKDTKNRGHEESMAKMERKTLKHREFFTVFR